MTSLAYLKKGSSGNVDDMKNKLSGIFERYKVPMLVMSFGLMLMLLPGTNKASPSLSQNDEIVSEVLSRTQGVGDCLVMISDKGVIVVCHGADSAKVRMQIIEAVNSYTGYTSDKITILKMAD